MIWHQWRVTVAPESAEAIAQLLLDHGCDGVQIEDTVLHFDESEDATLLAAPHAVITGYTQDADEATQRRKLETALRTADITAPLEITPLPAADWANQWRENFPPLRIGPFLIAPSWEEVAPEEAILIRLDPGLAFGTGQHPTTQLCLELLPECLERLGTNAPRVLDLGCGSGVLSIAAAKLGAQVTAADLDPHCACATRENAALNEVKLQTVQAAGLDWLAPAATRFDLVVANLMSDLLIRLAADISAAVRPGGVLLVSGISAPRAAEVEAALQATGLSTLQRRTLDGEQRGDWLERWMAMVLSKT